MGDIERITGAVDDDGDEYIADIERLASVVQDYLERHPEDVDAPVEDLFDWDRFRLENPGRPPEMEDIDGYMIRRGLWSRMKKKDPEGTARAPEGFTGFMWGMAYNEAHDALGIHNEAPNPAFMDLPDPNTGGIPGDLYPL